MIPIASRTLKGAAFSYPHHPALFPKSGEKHMGLINKGTSPSKSEAGKE